MLGPCTVCSTVQYFFSTTIVSQPNFVPGHQLPDGSPWGGEAPPGPHPAPLQGDDGRLRQGPGGNLEGGTKLLKSTVKLKSGTINSVIVA